MSLGEPRWNGRKVGQSAGRGWKQLLDSDDRIDLGTSTILAAWEHRPGGAKWGVGKATLALLRTELGSLVMAVPGNVLRIPYYVTLAVSVDYVLVTREQAVDMMFKMGGEGHAHRLFPDLARDWQPEAPPGRQV